MDDFEAGKAAQITIMRSYPPTSGYSYLTGDRPNRDMALRNFDEYTTRIGRNHAWRFFRLLLSAYTRCKKGLNDPLRSYPEKSRRQILGMLAYRIERWCAAHVNFSSPYQLDAYLKHTDDIIDLLWRFPRDPDQVRDLFCWFLKYTPAPFETTSVTHQNAFPQGNGDVEMVDESMTAQLSQDGGDVNMNGENTLMTGHQHSYHSSPTQYDRDGDIEMMDEDDPAACQQLQQSISSSTPYEGDVDMDTEATVAATRQDSPMQSDPTAHNQDPASSALQNSATVAGLATAVQIVVQPTLAGQSIESIQALPPISQAQSRRPTATERIEEAYAMERHSGMPFTFSAREFLEESHPDERWDEDRTNLLKQIFATLEQENDGWTKRHGSLHISHWRLERWAIKLEEEVAIEAEENSMNRENMLSITDKEVYDRGARRIIQKCQDPLAYFKNTIRRLMKSVTFPEDDKPVVEEKYRVKGNPPPRPSALSQLKRTMFDTDDAVFNVGAKRTVERALGTYAVVESPRKYRGYTKLVRPPGRL